MKAIINGFRYDTDKAIEIGSREHGEIVTNLDYWEATLYVTKRAHRYFLAGTGGAMTTWARSTGQNETSGGEGIRVMTKAEALAWAEQYLEPEEIEAGFAEDIQDA